MVKTYKKINAKQVEVKDTKEEITILYKDNLEAEKTKLNQRIAEINAELAHFN